MACVEQHANEEVPGILTPMANPIVPAAEATIGEAATAPVIRVESNIIRGWWLLDILAAWVKERV